MDINIVNTAKNNATNSTMNSSTSLKEDHSATVYLMKRMASTLPHIASILEGIVQDFSWDEDNMQTRSSDDCGAVNAYCNSDGIAAMETFLEIGMAASVLGELFVPLVHTALKVLLPSTSSEEFGEEFAYEHPSKSDNEDQEVTLVPSDESKSTKNEKKCGLAFSTPDYNHARLDYVITQFDIARLQRTASRRLHVDSIHHLPTIIYHANDGLNPTCEDYNGYHENAPLIEDYFGSAIERSESAECNRARDESPQVWSWMVVPQDYPKEGEVTRMSNSFLQGKSRNVPESISICSPTHPTKRAPDDESSRHCVICQEPFQGGDCLRVLPCQHLFHCGCENNARWLAGEDDGSGCIMCEKTVAIMASSSSHAISCEDSEHEPHGESYQSDGSVPSWAFARLGSILSSVNDA
jgi:hypothetical protein